MEKHPKQNEEEALSLENLGMTSTIAGGVQIDINTATKVLTSGMSTDRPLCDHNCRVQTDGVQTGNYECPAAKTLHPGLSVKTFAPLHLLEKAITTAALGILTFNQQMVEQGLLDRYYQSFGIPEVIQREIGPTVESTQVEINLFGGNPELHPEINELIGSLKERGFIVNLTTTGGRFMRDSKFNIKILENPPNILALSADDFDGSEEIYELANLSIEEIKRRWRKIPMMFGQKRKAYEAAYVSKMAQQHEDFPPVLFNLVVHQSNLPQIEESIKVLKESFPNSLVNLYPSQSAFYDGSSVFKSEQLPMLERFIDNRITGHFVENNRETRRLHYWLMLKSIFETYRGSEDEIARSMSGYGVWKCYETIGAARYVQIGASPHLYSGSKVAGGHLACFWNSETITLQNSQVWDMNQNQVADYMNTGISKLAQEETSPCQGCIMPRLNFDMLSTELGMDEKLIPSYLELRQKHAGF